MDPAEKLAHSQEVAQKVALLFQKRMKIAQEQYAARVQGVDKTYRALAAPAVSQPQELLGNWVRYGVDVAQRSVLFWDTLRQRGNNYLEHNQQGLPPVLTFEYETIVDARTFAHRPVNYALVSIRPPEGVTVDPRRRPYVIIDPRAGHGPGIGGFKDDSQVGVALAAGHPVYFVIFFRDPEPGQTLLDVCEAEKQFIRTVRERHPDSQKPAIVGNCQGGWAAMMLAAADPDDTGPVVINGAPMLYWGGAWQEGEGDNPMRYAGGMLGGAWLSSYMADRGNGIFDGAELVQNFENLNPANSMWDKYYHVFANADTEPPRFLEFERWWGGFYLMNREEIEWITGNLFVGNKLWKGEVKESSGKAFDLRDIKAPIILFASMGDNITPPQQAFNWVADIYGSTEEIKARGQVIIGLLHQSIGHLGIFVSGKVAKKEHAQIVSVMQSVESLPPGLYGMAISEHKGADGKVEYEVEFREHRLEDIIKRLNRLERADERPFEAVAAISEFNQRAYEMFLRPFVQATSNEATAKLSREFHPLRLQRWAMSDLNPFLAWLGPAAQMVKEQRQALPADDPLRQSEKLNAELTSASLDYYRAVRDAVTESSFFTTYANAYHAYLSEKRVAEAAGTELPADVRERPFVKQALANIAKGGYTEAFARVAYLLGRKGEPLPLSRLTMRQDLAKDYASLAPDLPLDAWRRIRGEQEIIAHYEPEKAVETLALMLDGEERARLLTLIDRVVADKRVVASKPTEEQKAMVGRLRQLLSAKGKAVPSRARRGNEKCSARRARRVNGTRHEKYERLIEYCKTLAPTPTAVAYPCDQSSLEGALDAGRIGLIRPILVGPEAQIRAVAAKYRLDLADTPIVDSPAAETAATAAVALVREGKAEALMKGSLHTDELMAAVVTRETGLRTSRRISHCFVMDVPNHPETLIVTDGAVNIFPTMEDKVHIIQNAIDLAHALQVQEKREVRVAILSAMETVNPKLASTMEAAALCKMADRGQITGALLDGPLALDNAISLEAAQIKKIDSPVAGRANVLVAPNLEAGNLLAKSLSFLAGADAAGIVLGARVPIVLTSRADSLTTRLASCAVAALVAKWRRERSAAKR